MRIAVAVVSYETRDRLRRCLGTVRDQAVDEVLVVDNGSTDGSVEMVRREFPSVTVHVEPSNVGYGGAANRAVARTAAPCVLVLNSDTELRPGAAAALADHLDRHPRVAVVGPRLLNPDGTLQSSTFPFPGPVATLLAEGKAKHLIKHVPGLRDRHLRTWPHDRVRDVPWVMGAALALRRAAFEEVDGFSEDYFMYFEEVDLCYRLRQAGWRTHFAPVADVVHVGGVSTAERRVDMRIQYYRSLLRFYRRHRPRAHLPVLQGIVRTAAAVHLMGSMARRLLHRDADVRARLREDVRGWGRIVAGEWTGRQPDASP